MKEDAPDPSDVTICTYVSPWALDQEFNSDKQIEEFREFINETTKELGFIINVDPERDKYVRSRPVPKAFKAPMDAPSEIQLDGDRAGLGG